MRKPNYNQERMQRERDKEAKAQEKLRKKQAQKAAEAEGRPAESGDVPGREEEPR